MKENLKILIEGMVSRYLMLFPTIILCSEVEKGTDASLLKIIMAVAMLVILTIVVFHTSVWLVNSFCEGNMTKLKVFLEVVFSVLLKKNFKVVMEYYLADDFDDGGTTEGIQETRQMFFRKGVLIYGT
jgi:hypothetical protein